ncbi:MAG TPA: hypothetical protein PKI78_11225 [Anaerolineales bacterium]|nr:hypothetical protein [Anaerolineales bacterium]
MNNQNENAHYDHQSFDHYPTGPMYPAGWDLSSLPSAPVTDSTFKADDSAEDVSTEAKI